VVVTLNTPATPPPDVEQLRQELARVTAELRHLSHAIEGNGEPGLREMRRVIFGNRHTNEPGLVKQMQELSSAVSEMRRVLAQSMSDLPGIIESRTEHALANTAKRYRAAAIALLVLLIALQLVDITRVYQLLELVTQVP